MEEKQEKKIETVSKEEIILLTFQPQQMLDEIAKLKIELSSEKMINIDLLEEVERLNKRSFKLRVQELLLRCLGGQWEEDKNE